MRQQKKTQTTFLAISTSTALLAPVWLYVPATLIIPETHRDVENEIYYWLHTIIVGQYSRKHDLDNTTRVNRQTIRQILHPAKDTKARNWLLARKIVYSDHIYSAGHFSKSYGLNPKYRGKVVRRQVTNSTIAAKILHHRLQRHDLKDTDAAHSSVFTYLESWANQIDIYSDKCFSENEVHFLTVDQITNGEIDFVQDSYGRIHSPFTRLFTPFRDHLHYKGQLLVNNDIRNSQVVFFLQLLLNHVLCSISSNPPYTSPLCCTNNLENDIARFKELVEQGMIYDELLKTARREIPECLSNKQKRQKQKEVWQRHWEEHISEAQPETAGEWKEERRKFQYAHRIKNISVADAEVGRSAFKQMFFTDVFFGKNQARTPLTELFQREFPTVYGFIQAEKQTDYRALAQDMQRAESRFVIDCVCRRLMEHHAEIPVVTVHDSILTTMEHAATVKRIMVEEFERTGIRATVRTDGEG